MGTFSFGSRTLLIGAAKFLTIFLLALNFAVAKVEAQESQNQNSDDANTQAEVEDTPATLSDSDLPEIERLPDAPAFKKFQSLSFFYIGGNLSNYNFLPSSKKNTNLSLDGSTYFIYNVPFDIQSLKDGGYTSIGLGARAGYDFAYGTSNGQGSQDKGGMLNILGSIMVGGTIWIDEINGFRNSASFGIGACIGQIKDGAAATDWVAATNWSTCGDITLGAGVISQFIGYGVEFEYLYTILNAKDRSKFETKVIYNYSISLYVSLEL